MLPVPLGLVSFPVLKAPRESRRSPQTGQEEQADAGFSWKILIVVQGNRSSFSSPHPVLTPVPLCTSGALDPWEHPSPCQNKQKSLLCELCKSSQQRAL